MATKQTKKAEQTLEQRVMDWFKKEADGHDESSSSVYLENEEGLGGLLNEYLATQPVAKTKQKAVSIVLHKDDLDKIRESVEDSCMTSFTKRNILKALE